MLTTYYWDRAPSRWHPDSSIPRRVTLDIERLQALSTDSCNEFMDHMGELIMTQPEDGAVIDVYKPGIYEGNVIGPHWRSTAVVPIGRSQVDVEIRIIDDDDATCGGGDDVVDVNPDSGAGYIRYRLDLDGGRVFRVHNAAARRSE